MTGESYIDVDWSQQAKHGQRVAGDVFLSRKLKDEGRIISVLSDGLGSGVKASVLANLTATMALRYTAAFVDLRQSAQTIMDTLPICEQRKISYSTFTIVDLDEEGVTRVIEHGNPPALVLRGSRLMPLERADIHLANGKDRVLHYTEFQAQLGDRIVFYSDGVSQSGMGCREWPLGWGNHSAEEFIQRRIGERSDVSAHDLAQAVTRAALGNDRQAAKDDITCGVIYLRHPRRLLVATGPPFHREQDAELAESLRDFPGSKAICGGTTALIVSRELKRPVRMCLHTLGPEVPPASAMQGINLITEGTLTLARTAEILDQHPVDADRRGSPAHDLARLMLESDVVHFLVGTRVNEAHQDPSVPVELDLRRNIVRKLASVLESRHLKETRLRFL